MGMYWTFNVSDVSPEDLSAWMSRQSGVVISANRWIHDSRLAVEIECVSDSTTAAMESVYGFKARSHIYVQNRDRAQDFSPIPMLRLTSLIESAFPRANLALYYVDNGIFRKVGGRYLVNPIYEARFLAAFGVIDSYDLAEDPVQNLEKPGWPGPRA